MKLALPLRQFRPHRCVAQTAAAAVAMWQQQLLLVLMALAVRFLLVLGDAHRLGSEVAEHVTMRCSLTGALCLSSKSKLKIRCDMDSVNVLGRHTSGEQELPDDIQYLNSFIEMNTFESF